MYCCDNCFAATSSSGIVHLSIYPNKPATSSNPRPKAPEKPPVAIGCSPLVILAMFLSKTKSINTLLYFSPISGYWLNKSLNADFTSFKEGLIIFRGLNLFLLSAILSVINFAKYCFATSGYFKSKLLYSLFLSFSSFSIVFTV